MKISELFERCLKIPYTRTPNHGDFAAEVINGTLYIYFEHSNGKTDWINNLDFPTMAYSNSEGKAFLAHRGFLRVFKSITPYLATAIENAKANKYEKIIIVGYSHGGALSVLCHEYLWYNLENMRDKIYTYAIAPPRVIWGRVSHLENRWQYLTTVINKGDLVPSLPPRALGYTHVGKILEIGKKGKYSRVNAHRPENILAELLEYESQLNKSKINGH